MFFDDVAEIPKIASKVGTSVFVVPKNVEVEIPKAVILKPETKSVISIEQVKELFDMLNVKRQEDTFVLIRPADKMSNDTSNALLKRFEEPGEHLHYVLVTDMPSKLLPTVRSRAAIYFLRVQEEGISADEEVKEYAKRLMVAKPADLPALAEEIAKKSAGKKNGKAGNQHDKAMEIVGTAIMMLEKTYLITGKDVYLKKVPRFLDLYDNLAKNGHVKLHLLADLI